MNKTCSKCKTEYPATRKYFNADKRHKDGLKSWCKICSREHYQEYKQTENGKKCRGKAAQKYYCTLNGRLRHIYGNMKKRCNNPKYKCYHCYGGRGIEVKFTSDEFVDYVKNDLGCDTYEKIKGLQIDRIDNDGNYEPGNIRFITCKENNNNKRKKRR